MDESMGLRQRQTKAFLHPTNAPTHLQNKTLHIVIPAIVLTCQRYAPLADHMINCYQKTWPDNPLRFFLPDGLLMQTVASQHPDKVALMHTGEGDKRGRFRAAVLDLLKDIKDDDWIYWCPDDKYPIWLDQRIAWQAFESLDKMPFNIAGLCIANRKTHERPQAAAKAKKKLSLGRCVFTARQDYKRIWLHQFLRARVIRHLFEGFPEVIWPPKSMDDLHKQIKYPDSCSRYIIDKNAMVLGESTHRGLITANCAKSLQMYQGIPEGFEISNQRIIIGRRPWSSRLTSLF